MGCSILQTCVPPYRVPLFDGLAEALGSSFRVVAGERFFDSSIQTEASGALWYSACRNEFLAGDRLLWQRGAAFSGLLDGPLVVEGNPRCLRTWLLLLQARRRNTPVAIWGHALGRNVGATAMAPVRRAMFSLASTIVCYCYAEREPMKRLFPKKEILVAGNSTVLARECSPVDSPVAGRNNVLFLGRLVEAKKPLLLLNALRELQTARQDIGAIFVGDGPERAKCHEFVKTEKLKDVTFTGSCFDRGELRRLSASCFAVASPGYVGLSVLDAQSFGLPVVYSVSEPNSPEVEVLSPGFNAVEFVSDEATSLAKALLGLRTERHNLMSRSHDFCALVRKNYTIERMVEQLALLLRRRDASLNYGSNCR